MPKKPRPIQTAAPARNFSLTTAERVRAIVAGPPAYMIRRRRIEDLRESLLGDLRAPSADERFMRSVHQRLTKLNALIEAHNRYYPIEANLPMDASGDLVDMGTPWKPMPLETLEGLLGEVAWELEEAPPASSEA